MSASPRREGLPSRHTVAAPQGVKARGGEDGLTYQGRSNGRVQRFRGSRKRLRRLRLTRREKWEGIGLLLFLVISAVISLVLAERFERTESRSHPHRYLDE